MSSNQKRSDLTTRQHENLRAKILEKAVKHVDKLDDNINGLIELSNGQIKSIEILMDRASPKLQSTELHEVKEPPKKDDLIQNLFDIINQNPDVARELKAALDKRPELKAIDAS